MATTTNFGWETPDDTDLVKDGAAAIRTSLNGVDTSFVDLKGGTSGQVLAKNSGTDLDFVWVAQDDSNAIQNAIVDAKGDLIGATAADTPARLAVGTNGQVLTADSTAGTGLVWATPTSGSMTQLATGTFSGSSTVISGLSGSYKDLRVIINGYRGTSAGLNLQLRINNDSTANRHHGSAFTYFGAGLTYNATFINGLTDGCPATATNTLIVIDIPNYSNTTTMKIVQYYSISNNDSTTVGKLTGANGIYNQIGAITGLTFLADGGTFAGGTYYVYGVN